MPRVFIALSHQNTQNVELLIEFLHLHVKSASPRCELASHPLSQSIFVKALLTIYLSNAFFGGSLSAKIVPFEQHDEKTESRGEAISIGTIVETCFTIVFPNDTIAPDDR